jgi:hypothetical protein
MTGRILFDSDGKAENVTKKIRLKYRCGGSGSSDTTIGHDHHPVSIGSDKLQVVQHDQHGDAILVSDTAEQRQAAVLVGKVEGSGGLIQQQDSTVIIDWFPDLGECTGHLNACPLTAGTTGVDTIVEFLNAEGALGSGSYTPIMCAGPAGMMGMPPE